MDLPGPSALKQLRLTVSAEGRSFAYYVSDLTNGKILSVSRSAAKAFMLLEDVVAGNRASRSALSEDQVRDGLKVVTYLRSVRDSERLRQTKLNPISIQFKFFDVGQFQPALRPFAQWFVGVPFLAVFGGLLLAALFIGTRNNWAIWVAFQQVFSLEALLTFGLIAPFLKVIHEFGHVLVATKFNIRVRQAGMNLIGLYPLPFVDCTEADLTARRRDRIWLSLAGIFTDFFIGLIAFMVWHLAESDAVQSVAGRVVAFSTLSSILFNANPLMKFDGYYAMVDLIGQRNLYTRATKSFQDFRGYITTAGASGAWPQGGRAGWGVLGYGLATFVYRILILYTIMVTMMPQYLGLGMVIALWGGYAMFLSPLMAETTAREKHPAVPRSRKWLGRLGVAAVFGGIIVFLPWPFVRIIPLHLDQAGYYSLSSRSEGFVSQSLPGPTRVAADDVLLRLENRRFAQEREILLLEKAEAELLVANAAGVSAAQSQAARDKLASVEDRLASLALRTRDLVLRAPSDGLFVPFAQITRRGAYLTGGARIGSHYPAQGDARLRGDFAERLVETFQTTPPVVSLWNETSYRRLPPAAVRLVETASVDATTGTLSFTLRVIEDTPPAALVGKDLQARLDFGARPVWEHIRFWIDGQIAAFRDAQLADQQKRLGGN